MNSGIWRLPVVLLALALAAGCAGPGAQMKASVEAAAAASVLSVSGEELPDRVRLTVEGSTGLAYTVFRLSEPLRLIVDLADTDVSQLGEAITVDLGNVSTVHPIQFDEAAGKIGRLEISLLELWEYETSRLDDSIIIDFIKPVTAAQEEPAPAAEGAVPAPPREMEVVELAIPSAAAPAAAPSAPAAEAPPAVEPLAAARFINAVNYRTEEGLLKVDFVGDGAVGKYKTMSLKAPTRLVVDIMGVSRSFRSSTIPVDAAPVSKVRVGDHAREGYLRFVLDMTVSEVPPFTIQPEGRSLVLRIGEGARAATPAPAPAAPAPAAPAPAAAAQSAPAAPAQAAPPAAGEKAAEVMPFVYPPPEEKAVEPAAAPSPAPAGGPVVSDIRYRLEEGGGAVLVVSDVPLNYNVAQPDDRHLVIELDGVNLPRELVRSQDTREVGGPVTALSSFNPKGSSGARVSLTVAPGTTYEVEQTGGTLTLVLAAPKAPIAAAAPPAPEAAPPAPEQKAAPAPAAQPKPEAPAKAAAPAKVAEEKRYVGERLTLDFQNADILNVLRLIAEVSGLNIITSEAVSGKISMRMVNVPWDQALDVILKTKGLDQVREGNVIRIAPRSQIESERASELKAREAQQKAEDLALEIIPISYSAAEELVTQLGGFLSSRGSINTDRRTNSLIVKDLQENIDKVKALVAELDVPTPQVRIEARIVIVDESYTRNLGIKWGGAYNDGTNQIFGNIGGPDAVYGDGNFLVNLPASNPTAVLGFSFGGVENFDSLDLRLSAMEQANKGRIISSPTIMVIQNEEANIEVNNPFPENRTSTKVDDTGATTTTEVTFPDIWTKLKITPQVTSNKDIFMQVAVEKDSKGQQAIFDQNTFTGVNTHKLETKIILQNHGTAVIGGVYTESKKDGSGGVPFLSKIPIFGWLFKNKNTESTREELLIFINASIVES